MSEERRVKAVRILILLVLVAVTVFIAVMVTQLTLVACPEEWSQVKPGMSEGGVIRIMGKPLRDCDPTDKKADCLLRGYEIPSSSPTNRTMIYQACDKVMYIFLGDDGTVARVWWGNS